MLGPRKLSLTKGEFLVSFFLPPAPEGLGRRLPALHPAHRDGHRRRGLGRQPDRRRQGRHHRGARLAGRGGAAKVLLVPAAAQAIVGSSLDRPAQDRLEAAARAACQPIDDKRGTIEFRTQIAGVLTRRAALIAIERAKEN